MGVRENAPKSGELWMAYGEVVELRGEKRPGVWNVKWYGSPWGTIRNLEPGKSFPVHEGARCLLHGLPVEIADVYVDGLDLFVVKNGEPDIDLGFMLDPKDYPLLRPLPSEAA